MSESIACPIGRHAREHGASPAVIFADKVFSYLQLEYAVASARERLAKLGVGAGERVAILGSNSVEYLVMLFALWRAGALAVLVSPRLPDAAVQAYLQNIHCSRILSLEKSVTGTNFQESASIEKLVPVTDLNVPADIMFTSGSSGEPKAAVHSFGNHYYNALAANEHIALKSGDRWLLSLPLYHVGGLGILWRTLLAGATIVIPQPQGETIQKNKITHVSMVPTQLHRLLSSSGNIAVLRKLKAILLGGSAIPDNLLRKAVDEKLPVYVTYGLTETASQVATSKRLTKENPLATAQILRHAQLRISPEQEILVKGKILFQGYLQGDQINLPLDKDGWFHTGDLGCLNEDGTLTVLGRKDNMFISGGENIHPEEIERHLCHIEGVVQAVVIPVKNEEFGVRPVAFVQTKEGTRLSRTQILSSLREYLPSFKLPDQIYSWPATAQPGLKPDRSYFLRLINDSSSLKAI